MRQPAVPEQRLLQRLARLLCRRRRVAAPARRGRLRLGLPQLGKVVPALLEAVYRRHEAHVHDALREEEAVGDEVRGRGGGVGREIGVEEGTKAERGRGLLPGRAFRRRRRRRRRRRLLRRSPPCFPSFPPLAPRPSAGHSGELPSATPGSLHAQPRRSTKGRGATGLPPSRTGSAPRRRKRACRAAGTAPTGPARRSPRPFRRRPRAPARPCPRPRRGGHGVRRGGDPGEEGLARRRRRQRSEERKSRSDDPLGGDGRELGARRALGAAVGGPGRGLQRGGEAPGGRDRFAVALGVA